MVLIKVKRGAECVHAVRWRVAFLFLCMIESVCTQITRQQEHERFFCYQKNKKRSERKKRRNTIKQWLHGNILRDKMKERENTTICGGTRAHLKHILLHGK